MINKGYFVIADITGYTAFLTGSELDHAQDILKSLFDTLLDQIKPPLIVSNFQGDAILTYAPEGGVLQGQTLLEVIENIYFAFTRKRENIRHATTCTCRACSNISNLDLKLFAHYGDYVLQDMRGKQELNGPDVIVAHRMMKNNVKESTGVKAYALFTESAINALGLQGMCIQMQGHSETYEHIGEVPMFVYDLKAAWEQQQEQNPVAVKPEDAWLKFELDLPLPPAMAWDFLTKPEYRARWMMAEKFYATNLRKGRVSAGSVNHCAHGKDEETQFMIMDWRPFDYISERIGLPMNTYSLGTTYFQPTARGTHVTWVFAKIEATDTAGKLALPMLRPTVKKMVSETFQRAIQMIPQMVEEERGAGVITFTPQPSST